MQVAAIDHIAVDVKNIDSLCELAKAQEYLLPDSQVNSLHFWKNGVKFFTISRSNKEKTKGSDAF